MKLLIKDNISGWRMTGLMGKRGKWFFGFSRVPKYGPMRCSDHDGYGFKDDCLVCNALCSDTPTAEKESSND